MTHESPEDIVLNAKKCAAGDPVPRQPSMTTRHWKLQPEAMKTRSTA
jgi:hypothetical protein